jgi:uncharacterized protein YegL
MKHRLVALAVVAATAATVALYPSFGGNSAAVAVPHTAPVRLPPPSQTPNGKPVVEVVFVLDTTGSMSGLIEAAKEKIWSIASTMARAQPTPEIRIGLVAYRDRGDDYVTRVVDLSADLDSMYATLMDFQANGGGDGPESVNQALDDAINRISWSQDGQAYRAVFLVGDAPPHMDYPDDVKYPQSIAAARHKGIVVNAIQCGGDGAAGNEWRQIASLGQGSFFSVDQAGSAVAVATPFDARLAELSARFDATRLYYGSDEERSEKAAKTAATEKLHAASTVASRARRAAFNASEAGKANQLGEGELVDDVASGRVELSAIDKKLLPAPLQAMAPAAQAAVIREAADKRKALASEIAALSRQREDFLEQEIAKTGGAKDSLDQKLYQAVREQAAVVGLSYEADAPAY